MLERGLNPIYLWLKVLYQGMMYYITYYNKGSSDLASRIHGLVIIIITTSSYSYYCCGGYVSSGSNRVS